MTCVIFVYSQFFSSSFDRPISIKINVVLVSAELLNYSIPTMEECLQTRPANGRSWTFGEYEKLARIYSTGMVNQPSNFSWKVFGHKATFEARFVRDKETNVKHRGGVITSDGIGKWKHKSTFGKHVFCDPCQHYIASLCEKKLADKDQMIRALAVQPVHKLIEFYREEAICRIRKKKYPPSKPEEAQVPSVCHSFVDELKKAVQFCHLRSSDICSDE